MLSSSQKHDWSNDGVTWITPDHHPMHLGGSGVNWPLNNVPGDSRAYSTCPPGALAMEPPCRAMMAPH
eukprot:4293185-Prymnesium_polylepis.1